MAGAPGPGDVLLIPRRPSRSAPPAGRAARALLAAAAIAAAACGGAPGAPPAPTGAAAETVPLRVLVVESANHPRDLLEGERLDGVLARAAALCARDLEVPVSFTVVGRISTDSALDDLRAGVPQIFASFDTAALAPFASGGPDAARTRAELARFYGEVVDAEGVEAVRAALEGEVPARRLAAVSTPAGLAGLLVDLHLETARAAVGAHGRDGVRLAWEVWEILVRNLNGAHVILTNQPLLSLAPRGEGVRTALAGGLRVGGTEQNPSPGGPGRASIVSTFSAWGDAPVVRSGRGRAAPEEVVGTMLAHETGHLLRGWGHSYDHSACLMALPRRFRVGAWIEDLDESGPCRRPHPAAGT